MLRPLARSLGLLVLAGTVSLASAQTTPTSPAADVAKAMAAFSKQLGIHDLKVCVPMRSDPTVSVCHAVVIANAGLQPFAVVCEETVMPATATTPAAPGTPAPGTTTVTCALPVAVGQAAVENPVVPAD